MIQDIENYLIENKLGSDSPYFTAMISATTNLLYDTNHKALIQLILIIRLS